MRICVFSGTTEGHELSRFLAANGVPAEVFVATEYGAAVMEPMPGITVHEHSKITYTHLTLFQSV